MSEIGKPPFFDPEAFCDVVESLIMSDEVERALSMLKHTAPSFYREHPTSRMLEIRKSLNRQLFTPTQYACSDGEGADLDVKALENVFPPRAQVLAAKVKELNEAGLRANIMEIGPGTFWLPYSLRARGLDFTYEYQSLTSRVLPFDKPKDDTGLNIFVCFELAEHLPDEWEIYRSYLKFEKEADYVYLSTPLHTCAGVSPDWRNAALGHLRCYSAREFYQVCAQMFLGYEWKAHLSDTITLEGIMP